jgi:hypothetical protein
MSKLLDSKKKIKKVNDKKCIEEKDGTKPVARTFEEKYKRTTTYVERSLAKKIDRLCMQERVITKTELINSALKDYMKRNYE